MRYKRTLALLLFAIVLLSNLTVVSAHESQVEHDKDLQAVLFGADVFLSAEQRTKFQAIADAAALCIDQFSTNDTARSKEPEFNELKKRIGFSLTFDDIELKKGRAGALVNVTAKTHRTYTHRGWNFPYGGTGSNFWEARKKILFATVNKELFGKSPGILARVPFIGYYFADEEPCNKQCEAFCELVYYVHILGDYEKGKKDSIINLTTTPLYRHEDPNNPALIQDIIALIPILFESQQWSYPQLILELEQIEENASKLYEGKGITTQEEADMCCEYAHQVLELLIQYIPNLLRNTDFFSSAFPTVKGV